MSAPRVFVLSHDACYCYCCRYCCRGSSVNIFLRKLLGKRFTHAAPGGEAGHVFFPDLYRKHPFEIFVTLLREPATCALSFYYYVNDREKLPTWLKAPSAYPYEHIWRYTFRRDLVEWASTPWVQRTLAQMFLRQFLARIENVTDNVANTIDVSANICHLKVHNAVR